MIRLMLLFVLEAHGRALTEFLSIPTLVNKGGNLEAVPDVYPYTDSIVVFTLIADLPLPTAMLSTTIKSTNNPPGLLKSNLMKFTTSNIPAIAAAYYTLESVQKTFSYQGAKWKTANPAKASNSRFKAILPPEPTEPANENTIKALGPAKYDKLVASLHQRTVVDLGSRVERGIPSLLIPALSIAGQLFFKKDSILNRLVQHGTSKSFGLDNLLETMNAATDYAYQTRNAVLKTVEADTAVLNDVQKMKSGFTSQRYFEKMDKNYYPRSYANQEHVRNIHQEIYSIEESIAESSLQIADNSNLIENTIQHVVRLISFQTCRSGFIPILLLSRSLLEYKLKQLEKALPEDQELVIPVEQIQLYYTQRLASCKWDSNGGILELTVPLKLKKESLQLYRFKPTIYAYNEHTCDLELSSILIVAERNSKTTFPISKINEESCRTESTKLCRVPSLSSSDLDESLCLKAILESTSSDIKTFCKVRCVASQKLIISTKSPGILEIIHLPKTGTEIQCGMSNTTFTHDYNIGALRFSLPPNCVILLSKREIAKSSQYSTVLEFRVEHIVPSIWTNLDDLFNGWKAGVDELSFQNYNNIAVDNWNPDGEAKSATIFTTQVPVISLLLPFIQLAGFTYVLYKVNELKHRITTGAVMIPLLDRVEAASDDRKSPYGKEIVIGLYIIVFFAILQIGWTILKFIKSKVATVYNRAVDRRAVERVHESVPLQIAGE